MTGMTSAMSPQTGMEVFTSDAARIGEVKAVNPPVMHVDRPMKRDIYIPLDYVAQVFEADSRVELSLTEEDVNDMDWEKP